MRGANVRQWRRLIASAATAAIALALMAAAASNGQTSGQTGGQSEQTAKATTAGEDAELAALPDDTAKSIVTTRCLLCHGAGLITQQHKDAAAWGRTVTQMRTWGAPIQDEDQAALVAYLTKHFGPTAAPR